MISLDYVIGVDGGGTKTEGVAYDLQGNVLAQCTTGFGNLVVNKEEALANIGLCIKSLLEELKSRECKTIYLGLAGADSGNNKELVREYVEAFFKGEVKVMNDADIALSALLKGEDGILTIAGTGSICFGRYNSKKARAGGWGHLLGDEGSGYYVAIEAFKNMTREQDLDLPWSTLTKDMLKALNFKEIDQIKGFIYSKSKAEVASLAPVVVNAAKAGDEIATNILKTAGIELARITEMVYKKLDIKGVTHIGLKGSIITKIDLVKESFKKYLSKAIENLQIHDEDVSAAKGAYYFDLKERN